MEGMTRGGGREVKGEGKRRGKWRSFGG